MALSPDIAPSQGSTPQGPTPEVTWPAQNSLTSRHIELLYVWQDERFPQGEPLARQGTQFKSELGEVGELVFGLTQEDLASLTSDQRDRIGDEISDVIIAGVGKLKVLGHSYEELRRRREKAIYDSSKVSEFERWQIDANGNETPLHLRLRQLSKQSLRNQKAYDLLGTEDVSALSERQKLKLSEKITDTMTLGFSVLNGMGESFDYHFRRKFKKMNEKYPVWLFDKLREEGLSDMEIPDKAKEIYEGQDPGEIILYNASFVQETG